MQDICYGYQPTLLTCNGRIQCARCLAKSTRTGEQCRRPALKASRTQKCQFHGGRSTGPRTPQGKARSASARLKHGAYTKVARERNSAQMGLIANLALCLVVLGSSDVVPMKGRPPKLLKRILMVGDIDRYMSELEQR